MASDPSTASRELDVLIDEVRISDIARSANWITTCYNTENAPTTFSSMGSEISLAPPASLYTGNVELSLAVSASTAAVQVYVYTGNVQLALSISAITAPVQVYVYTGNVQSRLSVVATSALVQPPVSAKLTIPISGTIRKTNGNFFDGTLRLMLSYSSAQNWTMNTVVIGTEVQFPIRHGGLPAAARITPNDVLRPATTNYRAQFLNPAGTVVDEELFTITGTEFHFEITVPSVNITIKTSLLFCGDVFVFVIESHSILGLLISFEASTLDGSLGIAREVGEQ